jgi:hypothetical protein
MPPVVHRLRFCSLILPSLALGACSTALLAETPYDDGDSEPDATVLIDAGRPRDAGAARDAATPRDGGAGVLEAGSTGACTRGLPVEGFATLLTFDCAMRPLRMCGGQEQLDSELANIARVCRVSSGVTLGFTLTSEGCPEQLRYDQFSVFGDTSRCIQNALEQLRFTCVSQCGLVRVGSGR